ncbi:MAG: SMP-30/gluconolactonase/LRE family protein [Acidobacteriota bacterium]
MRMWICSPRNALLTILILGSGLTAEAQMPVSGRLSESEWPLFHKEIARLEEALSVAPDKPAVMFELARTWASAKQYPETMNWLRKVAALNVGLDPSREMRFSALRGTREFEAVLDEVRRATPPVSHSRLAFRVPEKDLVPESMAWDPESRRFYFGSMHKGKILVCTQSGECKTFAAGLNTVLGLKVHQGRLWALDNSDSDARLLEYDVKSGQLIRSYSSGGKGHVFNDLVLASNGAVYLTDTRAGNVIRLARGSQRLEVLTPGTRFSAANGIALSDDENTLYVAGFPDGIFVVNLGAKSVRTMAHPADLCLATIDGMYFYRGTLVVIQNALMTPRVARLYLNREGARIDRFEVLERRNPVFDGITTGALVGGELFFMGNIQDDKIQDPSARFDPISVLKIRLR